MPFCSRRCIRGNENRIAGRIMCDDCHAAHNAARDIRAAFNR